MARWNNGLAPGRQFGPARVADPALGATGPYVTHSPFEEGPARYPASYELARLRLLRTPRGLDSWEPHYTLVQPFGGDEALFAPYRAMVVHSLALFREDEGERRWRVVRDPPLAVAGGGAS